MKFIKKVYLSVFSIFLILLSCTVSVSASQGTAYTYTISVDGNYIRTQEAYIPSAIYLKDAGLSQPNDIFISGNLMYLADTGNKRLVIYDLIKKKIDTVENDSFASPSGIFVSDSNIYVADKDAEAVFIMDLHGKLLKTIKRPQNSPLMGTESIFKPVNVVVSANGNIFVVGESAYEGLMQFSPEGEFQGYFAANKRSMTLLEQLQEKIFTDKQKEQMLSRKPRAIQNIDISPRDLIYSVTQSAEISYSWSNAEKKTENALKMHNMAGTNILSTSKFMDDEWNFVDIASGPYGNSYALTYTGLIYEYDSEGNLIFSFGGRAVSGDRYGLFTYAQALDLDKNGFIYVLDKERALVQVLTPTDFAVLTHKAIYDLENGNYGESEENWLNILQLNGMSKIAHIGYGKSLMRQQRYSEACEHFKIANDISNYSECFWEIRNDLINNYIIYAVAVGFIVLVLVVTRQIFARKKVKEVYSSYNLSELRGGCFSRLASNLKYSLTVLRHPFDANYYLKTQKRGDFISATVLIFAAFSVYMLNSLKRGFIFSSSTASISPVMLTLLFFISLLLFVTGNYMVATINDGEGSFKNIYVAVAYSLLPYIIITPLNIGLSYVLTLNEAFIINVLSIAAVVWSAVLVFIGIMHIHNYSFKQTVKNVVLTVLFMILALVVIAIIYLVWNKVFDFISSLISEVSYRAKK